MTTSSAAATPDDPRAHLFDGNALAIGTAAVMLAVAAVASLAIGPVAIAPGRVAEVLWHVASGDLARDSRDAVVILDVRLPRTLLALLVGAGTAVAGAVMQDCSGIRSPIQASSAFPLGRAWLRRSGLCSAQASPRRCLWVSAPSGCRSPRSQAG